MNLSHETDEVQTDANDTIIDTPERILAEARFGWTDFSKLRDRLFAFMRGEPVAVKPFDMDYELLQARKEARRNHE